MSVIDTRTAVLSWKVLTVKRPGLSRDLPRGKEELMWVANSSTLICGQRDAILVDTFLTADQSQTLLDWVVANGKNLTAIYITHGHGDHFFGLAPLLERFPRAKAVAIPSVVDAMKAQLLPCPHHSMASGASFFQAKYSTACCRQSHLIAMNWNLKGTSS